MQGGGFLKVRSSLVQSLLAALGLPEDERDLVERGLIQPPDPEMGDIALPCFPFASILKTSPHNIAKDAASKLMQDPFIERLNPQGPYLNIFLKRSKVIPVVLMEILEQSDSYGRQNLGKDEVIVIDYSHPNIAKPFHFGHLRSTNIGADLARILDYLGYRVFRKNYIGDWGTQFGFVIYAWQKYGDEKILEERAVDYLVELYIRANKETESDPKIHEEAKSLFKRLEEGDEKLTALWKRFRALSIETYEKTYARLGVEFDSFEGEAAISRKVDEVISRFQKAGVAIESENAIVVEVSDVLNREIAPCMLRKSDGSSTYAARDCAEAIARWEDHKFAANMYVCSRQEDHFAQVFAALKKLARAENWEYDWSDRCENISFGYVRGMSTRKGSAVWLGEVLEEARDRARAVRLAKETSNPGAFPRLTSEQLDRISESVGLAALLYNDVSASRMRDLDFDWDTVLRFDGNTGPYLQYTYARIAGVFRKAEGGDYSEDSDSVERADFKLLTTEEEWSLVLAVREFPKAVLQSGRKREPHEIAGYLQNLAMKFNNYYGAHRILNVEHKSLSKARLGLLKAVQNILGLGMNLLGISALDVM